MLLAVYDPPAGGSRAQHKLLRDNLATFLGAGTETTAVALSWIWYLLSTHPDAERKLVEEVDSVLRGAVPTFDDLPRLPYTRMVIDETLRLYPPAFVVSRTAIAEDEIGGFRIPAQSAVFLSAWTTHRSRLYWENPDEFDPERFPPERSSGRLDYAYYPFGEGPRKCIGDRFSIMEQTLALAMVAQKYRVRVVDDHPIRPDPVFTLRPSGGIRATLGRR
jgi:cytochrome P450